MDLPPDEPIGPYKPPDPAQLQEAQRTIAELNQRLEAGAAAYEELVQEASLLRAQTGESQASKEQAADLQAQVTELEDSIARQRVDIFTAQRRAEEAEKLLTDEQARTHDAEAQRDAAMQNMTQAAQAADGAREEETAAKQLLQDEMRGKLLLAEEASNKALHTLDELSDRCDQAEVSLAQATQTSTELQARLSQAEAEVAQALDEKQSALTETQTTLDEIQNALSEKQIALEQLQATSDEFEAEATRLQAEAVNLTEQIAQHTTANAQLESEKLTQQEASTIQEETSSKIREELVSAQSELEEVTLKLNLATDDRDTLQAEMRQLDDETQAHAASIKIETDRLRSELEEALSTGRKAKAHGDEAQVKLESLLAEAARAEAALQTQHAADATRQQELRKKLGAMEASIGKEVATRTEKVKGLVAALEPFAWALSGAIDFIETQSGGDAHIQPMRILLLTIEKLNKEVREVDVLAMDVDVDMDAD